MSKVQLVWQVDDWYVGGNSPQNTDIYLDDFYPDESDAVVSHELDRIVQREFELRIYPVIKNKEQVIAAIRKYQEENREDDTDE